MATNGVTNKKTLGADIYADYSNNFLLKAFSEGPARLRTVIKGLTEQDLKARPIDGKWSIAEILVHLADGEIIAACRIRQAYCEHTGPFPYYSEDDWSKKLNYQDKDLFEVSDYIMLFDFLRKTTSSILQSCTGDDWLRSGVHPQYGDMSIRSLLELSADHSERHIEQILERRRLLGKRLYNLESILSTRLY